MVVSWLEYVGYGFGCAVSGQVFGYFLGLRETKRRLKAHQEVTDRLMGRVPDGVTKVFSGTHDDLLDASGLAGTVYPTYGGIFRSANPFAVATQQRQANQLFGGSQMQNQITYSAAPSKFASIAAMSKRPAPTAEQRDEFRKRIYEKLKKEME